MCLRLRVWVAGVTVVPKGGSLIVRSGERQMTIKWDDLKDYRGERAQRGVFLSQGWRKVERLEASPAA